MIWNEDWEIRIVAWVSARLASADSGHGMDHVRRVVVSARQIAIQEQAQLDVVMPAAWLHDCVLIAKDSPQRSQASRLAADQAADFLNTIGYAKKWIDPVAHCIESHSFSAALPCRTLEARIVQDADRLDALGAIGIARCFMIGGAMQQRLYDPDDPFPVDRAADDKRQSIDHFFTKLLTLPSMMNTRFGKELAERRARFIADYLFQLADETGVDPARLKLALSNVHSRVPTDRRVTDQL